jgi:hypothetical protein
MDTQPKETTTENSVAKYPKPPFPEQQQPLPGLTSKMQPVPDQGEHSYIGAGRLRDERRALIIGGDSGMGRAAAIAFAREGADVALNCLPEEEPDAQKVAALMAKAGRKAVLLPGDIRDSEFCKRLVADAIDKLGDTPVTEKTSMQEEKLREAIVGELKRQAADSRSPSASAVRRSRRQWQDRYRRARHGDRRFGGGRPKGPPTDRQRQLIIVVAPLVGVDKILQENGTSRSCRSQRRRSSWATSAETSSDQPSAVLNPITRTGFSYGPSSRASVTASRSVESASVRFRQFGLPFRLFRRAPTR